MTSSGPPAAGGRARTPRVPGMPMRVPGGRDVRQAPTIGSHGDRDVELCVCKHRAPRPVRERRPMLCPLYIGTQIGHLPQSPPSPHSKNH